MPGEGLRPFRARPVRPQVGGGRRHESQAAHRAATSRAAQRRDRSDSLGCFRKSVDPVEDTIDASTLLTIKLGILEPGDARAERLVQTVERRLWVKKTGGVARYENDNYYGHENPWIICTLWLAEAHLLLGRTERTREMLEWAAKNASPTGLLPEQIDARTGEHTSVTPLVWSHSTFLDVVNKYHRHMGGHSARESGD